MTTILLARHGESDWNAAGRWQGHADRPLSETGRRQAAELARRLAATPLDGVYSSDLTRALDTARPVAAAQGLDVVVDADLREVDVGSWSGLRREEAAERFPAGFARWLEGGAGWDDGETYERMGERAVAAVRRIAAAHSDGLVLVVAHGGSIRAVHAAVLGVEIGAFRLIRDVEPNARLSAIRVERGELAELWSSGRLDRLLARGREERCAAAGRPPTPAG